MSEVTGANTNFVARSGLIGKRCPSSNDLRLFVFLEIGVSGSVFGLI